MRAATSPRAPRSSRDGSGGWCGRRPTAPPSTGRRHAPTSSASASGEGPQLVAGEGERRGRGDRQRLREEVGQATGLDEQLQQPEAEHEGARADGEEAQRLQVTRARRRLEGPAAVPDEVARHGDEYGRGGRKPVVEAELPQAQREG